MALEPATNEVAIAEQIKQFLFALSISLSVATLTQIFSWFRRIPYTLLLVIVGLGLAFLDVRLVNLSPGLILVIFLPPLLFEAAWNLKWSNLKRDFLPICLYAVVGVVVSIAGIGLGLNQFAGLDLSIALLVGASLSATDPVSVTALFSELGASKRLTTLMEGESLFNDGMAVVAFGLLVTLPLGNTKLEFQSVLSNFLEVVGIGIGVGGLIGFGISYLTQRFDLPLVEQSLTLVSAYSTYLITENLGGSGVIGVVTTALILGNFGSRIGMNPRTRIIVTEFWDFLAFFVNSIVFLLIGDQIHFIVLGRNLKNIAVTIAAMTVARSVSTYTLSILSNWLAKSKIPLSEQTVLWWGGLRGSVSIALALSIPMILPQRNEVIATVFGAVLFTLLVQGLTTQPLLEKLQLLGSRSRQQEYLETIGRQVALQRTLEYLEKSQKRPGIKPEFYQYQKALLSGEILSLQEKINMLIEEYPDLQEYTTEQLRGELLAIEADTYAKFIHEDRLNQELSPLLETMNDRENWEE
ncbi:sodium:proton antiporter [Hapalosiphon sp. MRB220]|nr:sodium:proton antiporter [Hapalosiphon sp. MRB220]